MNTVLSRQSNEHSLEQIINGYLENLPRSNLDYTNEAEKRNSELTKPSGSLGRLEELAIWYAGWQGAQKKDIASILIAIFAGNHGVANKGVSAFPIEVTKQMVVNFEYGGAAINQLASLLPSTLKIVPIDLDKPTKDFTQDEAISFFCAPCQPAYLSLIHI